MSDRDRERQRQRQFRKRGHLDGLNDRRVVFPDEPAYRDARTRTANWRGSVTVRAR